MKSSVSFSLLIFLILFYGCKCKNETEFCPGISPELSILIRYTQNDSIIYRNDMGERIKFKVNDSHHSQNTSVDCKNTGYGCMCDPCETYGHFKSDTQDSIWRYYDSASVYHDFEDMMYQVNQITPSTAKLDFHIANLYYSVRYPIKDLDSNQILIPQIKLGPRTYQDVVLCNIDTTSTHNGRYSSSHYFMTEIYFQPEYGVIAFHDIRSNSLFYLN